MGLKINGSTSGSIEIDVPAVAGTDTSITIPATSGGEFIVSDSSGNIDLGPLDINGSASDDSVSIDSSGRVLIGTTTVGNANADELTLENSSGAAGVTIRAAANFNSNVYFADPGSATIGQIEYRHNGDTMRFYTFGSEVMRNTSTGELMFNSGYGSVATAFGVRAWVNFQGTSTVTIRDSGNVSSITDNGTGDYTVNFSNAMPDDDYAILGTATWNSASWGLVLLPDAGAIGTGSFDVITANSTNYSTTDSIETMIAVVR